MNESPTGSQWTETGEARARNYHNLCVDRCIWKGFVKWATGRETCQRSTRSVGAAIALFLVSFLEGVAGVLRDSTEAGLRSPTDLDGQACSVHIWCESRSTLLTAHAGVGLGHEMGAT